MAFKLGKETRGVRNSKDTPIFRKKLDKGILGEANMDGSIYIDKSVKPGSAQEKQVISHEGLHAKEMKSGKIAYGDDFVRDGKIKYNGKWHEEGSNVFPWEKRAVKAEKQPVKSSGGKLPDGRAASAAYQKRK